MRVGNLGHLTSGEAQVIVAVGADAVSQVLGATVGEVESVAVAIHVDSPHFVGNTIYNGAALGQITVKVEVTPLGHVFHIDVGTLVLRGKSGVNHHIVECQTHGLAGARAGSHADVPCQIHHLAGSKVHLELLAGNRCGGDGHCGGACRGSVGCEIVVEISPGTGPVSAIGRSVELHSKALGVVAIAILLDVVAKGELTQWLASGILDACHHVDASRAVGNCG